MRIKLLALVCALALLGPAGATETTVGATHPTMEDMQTWKHDLLSKYDDIVYLEADARPIGEAVFFATVVGERRGFTMQTDSGAPKRITIRLLTEAETQAAQAGKK